MLQERNFVGVGLLRVSTGTSLQDLLQEIDYVIVTTVLLEKERNVKSLAVMENRSVNQFSEDVKSINYCKDSDWKKNKN